MLYVVCLQVMSSVKEMVIIISNFIEMNNEVGDMEKGDLSIGEVPFKQRMSGKVWLNNCI